MTMRKKIEQLKKRVILDLTINDIQKLKGGKDSQDDASANVRTYAHNTHVNTCFTKNCCNRFEEDDFSQF